MGTWNDTRACKDTWATLLALDQSEEVFDASGDIKVKQFTFWSDLDTPDMHRTKARALAVEFDNVLIVVRKNTYQPGVQKSDAISAVAAVLGEGEKTMSDLSDVVGTKYLL